MHLCPLFQQNYATAAAAATPADGAAWATPTAPIYSAPCQKGQVFFSVSVTHSGCHLPSSMSWPCAGCLERLLHPQCSTPPRLVQSNYHAPCLPFGRGVSWVCVCVLFVLLFARRRHRRFGWWKVYNFIRPYRNWVSVAFSCISRRRRVTTWQQQQQRCSDSCHAL